MTGAGNRREAQELPASADFTAHGMSELSPPPPTWLSVLFLPEARVHRGRNASLSRTPFFPQSTMHALLCSLCFIHLLDTRTVWPHSSCLHAHFQCRSGIPVAVAQGNTGLNSVYLPSPFAFLDLAPCSPVSKAPPVPCNDGQKASSQPRTLFGL